MGRKAGKKCFTEVIRKSKLKYFNRLNLVRKKIEKLLKELG